MTRDWLVLSNLAATFFLTGLAWFLQVVHLPLMLDARGADFTIYAKKQRIRNTSLMAAPMLVELITAVWLAIDPPPRLARANLVVAALLVAQVWISTCAIVPLHSRLIESYDEGTIRAVIRRNWVRTIAWTSRAVLMTWLAGVLLS